MQPVTSKTTREAVNIYYVYHFPIFIFLIQVTGLIFIALIYALIKLYLKDFSYALSNAEKARNLHLLMSPFAFVFITGEGILIFRICRNIKTWQVKVGHIVLSVISVIIGGYGIYAMYKGKEDSVHQKTAWQKEQEAQINKTGYSTVYPVNPYHVDSLHPALGYFSVGSIALQFITGTLVMVMNVHSFYIDMVSELHGFLGVFTLITTSITAVCGIMTKMNDVVYFDMKKYYEFTDEYKLSFGAISTGLIFTWGIIYVVINPHFEWVKIGPL